MGLRLVKNLFVKSDIHEDNIIVSDYIYLGFMWNPLNYTFNNYYVFIDDNSKSYLINQSFLADDNGSKKEFKAINRYANLHVHSQINLGYISSKASDEKKEEIQNLISSFNANTSYSSDLVTQNIIDDYSICNCYKKLIDGQIKERQMLIPNQIIHKIEITNYNISTMTPLIENLDSDRYKDMEIIKDIGIKFLFFDKTFWTEEDNIVVLVYELSHPDFEKNQYALIRATMTEDMLNDIKSNSNLYDFSKVHTDTKYIDMGNNRLCQFSSKLNDSIIYYGGFHFIDRVDKKFKVYITGTPLPLILHMADI